LNATGITNLRHWRVTTLVAIFTASAALLSAAQALAPTPAAAWNEENCPADSADPFCKDQRSAGDSDDKAGDGRGCVIVWFGLKPRCVQDVVDEASNQSEAHPAGTWGDSYFSEKAALKDHELNEWLAKQDPWSYDECGSLWNALAWNDDLLHSARNSVGYIEDLEDEYSHSLDDAESRDNDRRAQTLRKSLRRIWRKAADKRREVLIANGLAHGYRDRWDELSCGAPSPV
jgi:hypothetical protein